MSVALSVTQAAPSCSEHELVAAVRRGDDRAFEELYSRYRARIGSYVFGMVGDHQRAEDVAQEVFISALRRLRDTERPIAFKPWIYEIAKNACIDEFRRSRRAREVPLQDDEDDGAALPLVSNGLEAAIENKQRLENLRGAFHGLSESHHRLLVMRELEGLSYSQIGEQMGMSKPVVESTLFRARKRLGEEYDELVSGRRCEHVQALMATDGERPLRSLGIRERRQFARHLAHCQPCRRHARMAGVDESFFHTPGLAAKLAALLPFPFVRWRRSRGGGDETAASGSSHAVAALQSLPVVARLADPSSPIFGMSRAGAAAAALLIAGAGGGFVAGIEAQRATPRHGAPLHAAPARHSVATPRARATRSTPAGAAAGGGSSGGRGRKLSRGGGSGGGGGASGGGSGNAATPPGSTGGQGGGPSNSTPLGTVGSTLHGVTSGTGGTSNTLGQAVSGASNGVNQITQGASNAASPVTQGAANAVNQVTQGASNALGQATQGPSNAVNQVTQGPANAVGQVTGGATNAASKVTSGVSNTLNPLTHP